MSCEEYHCDSLTSIAYDIGGLAAVHGSVRKLLQLRQAPHVQRRMQCTTLDMSQEVQVSISMLSMKVIRPGSQRGRLTACSRTYGRQCASCSQAPWWPAACVVPRSQEAAHHRCLHFHKSSLILHAAVLGVQYN